MTKFQLVLGSTEIGNADTDRITGTAAEIAEQLLAMARGWFADEDDQQQYIDMRMSQIEEVPEEEPKKQVSVYLQGAASFGLSDQEYCDSVKKVLNRIDPTTIWSVHPGKDDLRLVWWTIGNRSSALRKGDQVANDLRMDPTYEPYSEINAAVWEVRKMALRKLTDDDGNWIPMVENA